MRQYARTKGLGMILAVLVFLGVALAQDPASPPDIVLYNGKILTVDARDTVAEAVAIASGRIVAVGSNEAIRARASSSTRLVDLGGHTVIPGLADDHFHGAGGGPGVDLSRARSIEDVVTAIAERAEKTPVGDVILTNSDWHEGQLAEQRLPYRRDLDRAALDHPVVVVRGGHEYILNSAALHKWGIDESTPEPEGGRIGRYDEGSLNGELVDTAKRLVKLPRRPEPDLEDRIDALAAEHRKLNASGLTSIRYAGAGPDFFRALSLMKERGLLTIRVNFLYRPPATITGEEVADLLASWKAMPDQGDRWLRVGGIKLAVDGGFEGGLMREPYAEPFGKKGTYYGLQTVPTARYKRVVRELDRLGWRVATHAVGDAAIDLVLDAYEEADGERSIRDRRWSIEHGFIPRADQFPRMKRLGVLVTAQNHLYLAAPSLVKYWGAERARWVTPLRTYLDAGIRVSSGTDSPVVPYSPFWTLYHFITRDTISAGVMGKDQRIGRSEALRLATIENAYLTLEEDLKGSIEPGKIADLVVLSDDLLTCPQESIETMKALVTIVEGRVVYQSPDSAWSF